MKPAWLTADTARWVLTVLAIPLALAYVSHRFEASMAATQAAQSAAMARSQAADARLRLYTELLSKREQADTDVRKDMFATILSTFMKNADGDLDKQLVKLELLASNFQDSLNLSPLFRQLQRDLATRTTKDREALTARLEGVANDVKNHQLEALQLVGAMMDGSVSFATLDTGAATAVVDQELMFTDPSGLGLGTAPVVHKKHFNVEVLERDRDKHRLTVRVFDGTTQWIFGVDPYDFPLVDFTRMSGSERFTVTITNYNDERADLKFVYFPSSRSGASDKPYIDQVLAELRVTQ